MPIGEQELLQLNKYANNLCAGRNEIYYADMVQDAIIESLESGKDVNIDELKKEVRKKILGEKNHSTNKIDLNTAYSKHDTTRYCKGCKDNLPINAFRILRYKNKNKEIISHLCISCTNKYYRNRRANKINLSPAAAQRAREKALIYYHKNKHRRNRIMGTTV